MTSPDSPQLPRVQAGGSSTVWPPDITAANRVPKQFGVIPQSGDSASCACCWIGHVQLVCGFGRYHWGHAGPHG
jgi:hypothetical protein